MARGSFLTRRWRSSGGVLALAVAAAFMVFAACGVLVYYASVSVDRITEARETRLMERSVVRRLTRLKDDVASVSVWTDAYDKTARQYDAEWAQVNYGTYFHDYLHHDVSLVLDARDRPLYASIGGEAVEASALSGVGVAARRLVSVVRAEEVVRQQRDPNALAFDRVAMAQATVRAGDKVYLLAASTIVPEPENTRPLLPGPAPVIISGVEVGPAYLAELDHDFGLRRARLVAADAAVKPAMWLADVDGIPVGGIAWTPERPGVGVYSEAKWAILGLGLAVLGAVALVIYRLWRMARQVVRARDLAEAGDRAKSEFIANMSHEIRTPLNGVLGMAQAMEGFELSPDQRGRLRVIRESGRSLLTLLNDVLDLSKIEAGKVELTETTFRLEDKVAAVGAIYRDLATEKGLDLNVSVAPEAMGFWLGDTLRIRQVLTNLVSNAVKFTETGSVTLAAEATSAGLRFTVTDTGIGFEQDIAAGLFRKFEQADASTTRRYGGTGLGLSISHSLTHLMGGTITARSRPGEGACFTLELPLKRGVAKEPAAPTPAAVEAAPSEAAQQTLRILAAEDNATNRMVLHALIEPLGAELTLVTNGLEAVEAFAGGRFDVVLMDVQMPEMNGLDATRAIRRREADEGWAPTPVLALTANVMSHQLESYLAAGMDGHIAKPLDVTALYAALESVVGPADEELAA
jgi:signal transduction histidine kinase/ActR/RegA family two-component response regulator